MSTDYFHCRTKFQALPGVRTVRSGPYSFDLPPGPVQDFLAEHFAEIDAMIEDGRHTKTSHGTHAAVFTIPGGRDLFIKCNVNRGLKFTAKYFFVPARVFRAALAAKCVEEAGVATPHVLAAGEKRSGRILQGGYLVTEAVPDTRDLLTHMVNSPEAPADAAELIRETAGIAAKLHGRGIYHGDLKLVNVYRSGNKAPCGVWDLDSAQLFPARIPRKLIVRELGRIVSSIVICAEQNPAFPDDFFNLNRIARDLLDAYSASSGTPSPSPDEVMDAARKRWLSKSGLRFDYGGKTA